MTDRTLIRQSFDALVQKGELHNADWSGFCTGWLTAKGESTNYSGMYINNNDVPQLVYETDTLAAHYVSFE